MSESLRHKTLTGIFWSAIERFSFQGIQFVIQIIMARLLLPSDYGMIGMLLMFLQVSQIIIDSGFANALIQKRERTEEDFSTVLYFNIFIGIILTIALFFSAPLIEKFYNIPGLTDVTRLLSLTLVINSIYIVHKTKLVIDIDFKTQSKISLIAAMLSGIIGICMAYYGYGVWALVWQSITNSLFLAIMFVYYVHWWPKLIFSIKSFKTLFSFGSKLLLSSIIHSIYSNLYILVIGKKFSSTELGYYTRAEQFAIFPSSNINSLISRVTYPILSSIQDDNDKLAVFYRKYIQVASYIIFPLMIGLAVLAEPIINVLLTAKWNGVIILLQILCFDWMFDHLSIINLNLLWVKGRSDLSLKLEIVKKTLAIIILVISIPFGLIPICIGRVVYSLIATYLNTRYTKQLIGLSFRQQLSDIIPSFVLSLFMGLAVMGVLQIVAEHHGLQIVIGIITGIIFYLSASMILKMNSFTELLTFLRIKH